MSKLVSIAALLFLLLPSVVSAQKVRLDKEIYRGSRELMIRDSLTFVEKIAELKQATTRDEIEFICSSLNKPKYFIWIKQYSNEIVNKLAGIYKKGSYDDLLARTNLPDSIKKDILGTEYGSFFAKALLGDSLAVEKNVRWYVKCRDMATEEFYPGSLSSAIGSLLEINNPRILKSIFADMASERVIVTPNGSDQTMMYYTIPYSFILALKDRYYYEPIFNEKYMEQFFGGEDPRTANSRVRKYCKLVEDFVWRTYGIKVKIKTSFLLAGWPNYGYFL